MTIEMNQDENAPEQPVLTAPERSKDARSLRSVYRRTRPQVEAYLVELHEVWGLRFTVGRKLLGGLFGTRKATRPTAEPAMPANDNR